MTRLETATDDGTISVEVTDHEVYYRSNETGDEREFVSRVIIEAEAVTQSFIDAVNTENGTEVRFYLVTDAITYDILSDERTMVDSTTRDPQTGESSQVLQIGLVADAADVHLDVQEE